VSASLSPSASASASGSASLSPSASPSPSGGSSSASASASISASLSPSASVSPSASASPSITPSLFTRQALVSMPTNKNDLAITYTEQQVIDVSTDNGIYVDMTALSPTFLAHEYKFNNTNNHNIMLVKVNAKSTYDPRISPVYLQVFNMSTSGWETIDTCDWQLPDTDFDMKARIYSNQANYYDTANENQVAIRVWQNNNET
jgi:hypothetical protein